MAKVNTARFEQMVLEMETATAGTYEKIAGLIGVTVSRTNNMQTTEVPDTNEALPNHIERAVISSDVKVSGTGVWAKDSHEALMDWFEAGTTKNIRISHLAADTGDTKYETGPAYLVSLNHSREKGSKVSAEISIEFDGKPTRSAS